MLIAIGTFPESPFTFPPFTTTLTAFIVCCIVSKILHFESNLISLLLDVLSWWLCEPWCLYKATNISCTPLCYPIGRPLIPNSTATIIEPLRTYRYKFPPCPATVSAYRENYVEMETAGCTPTIFFLLNFRFIHKSFNILPIPLP